MGHVDALAAVLANPVLRPLVERAAESILGQAEQGEQGRRDFSRLHWGQPSAGLRLEELPPEPDRLVLLGDLTRVGYLTRKGKGAPVEEFVHVFGDEQPDGSYLGPRPLLVVGMYDDDEPESLHILRAASPYRVTSHGIEG